MRLVLNKKTYWYAGIALAVIVIVGVIWYFAARPGEGRWSCVGGQWIAFGNPPTPQPQGGCSTSGAVPTASNPGAAPTALNVNFNQTGVIVKENDAPVGWQFQYGGNTAYLFFSNQSSCDTGKGPGPCSMSKSILNIEGSTVKVTGETSGNRVIVATLVWVAPTH